MGAVEVPVNGADEDGRDTGLCWSAGVNHPRSRFDEPVRYDQRPAMLFLSREGSGCQPNPHAKFSGEIQAPPNKLLSSLKQV